MVKTTLFASLLCIATVTVVAQERSFRFRNAELKVALDSLLTWYDVPLIYLDTDVVGRRVTIECEQCEFAEALRSVLTGQDLRAKTIGQQVVLHRQPADEQRASTIAGTVRDSLTQGALIGAEVLLFTYRDTQGQEDLPVYRWCAVNQYGFFSLRNIDPGTYVLSARRLGYNPVNKQITVAERSETTHTIELSSGSIAHPEIIVEGRRSDFSAMEGIAGGIYVRATPSDHNQYLLEGARIYNPVHFGGLLSTFNGDAIKDVQVLAGGVPPYYGGRIGGILDVALRDGSERMLRGSASLGSLTSGLFLEGPIFPNVSFLLSGRRGYPDVILPRLETSKIPSDLRSTEAMSKITYHLSGLQKLSLSTYMGQDGYHNRVTAPESGPLSNSIRWGNTTANLRWMGAASPSLFFALSAIYSRYGFKAEHRYGPAPTMTETTRSDFSVEDATIRAHAEYYYDEQHTLWIGAELVRHRLDGTISELSTQVGPMPFNGLSPWELAVYFQDQWRLTSSVMAEAGARATSFIADQGSFSAVDPRMSLLMTLSDDFRLFSSFSAVNQFIHAYRHSGIFLYYPSIFMYSSTDKLQPTTFLQVSVGAENTFEEDRYRLAVASYYRVSKELHEFVYDTISGVSLQERALSGKGDAFGIEVTFDKRIGTFTGSVRYGLSWATNTFAELNEGRPFRPRFDRRHELHMTASYVPSEDWSFEALCVLSANQISLLSSEAQASATQVDPVDISFTPRHTYSEPYDLDGGRLPGFQRIELRVSRKFLFGAPVHATLRLLNGYGLIDPFVWELQPSADPRLRWRIRLDAPPLFPLYPVLSVGMRF